MPNSRHLVGHPLRVPGRGDAGVGDHQDPRHVVLREVVADLVGGALAELQARGAVGEDGLGSCAPNLTAGHHAQRGGDQRATDRATAPDATSASGTQAAASVVPPRSRTTGSLGARRWPRTPAATPWKSSSRPVGAVPVKCSSCTPSRSPTAARQPGLLAHLAHDGVRGRLAVVDPAAGQRPGARVRAARPSCGSAAPRRRARTSAYAASRCRRAVRWWASASRTIGTVATAPASTSASGVHRGVDGRPVDLDDVRLRARRRAPTRRTPDPHGVQVGRAAVGSRSTTAVRGADPERRADRAVAGRSPRAPRARRRRAGSSPKSMPPPGSVHSSAVGDPRREQREQDVAVAQDHGVRRARRWRRGRSDRIRTHGSESRERRGRGTVCPRGPSSRPAAPAAAPAKARDPWFDNAKMALVVLVVVGHSWTLLPHEHRGTTGPTTSSTPGTSRPSSSSPATSRSPSSTRARGCGRWSRRWRCPT